METRANYVLIGAFVLMAAAALMLFTVWISRAPFSRDFETYDVVFEGPVNGLGEGGEVRFNGIKVGEVTQLSLDRADPNRVIARINVDAQTPVRVDSVAQLNFMGITGVTFIQILAGSPDQPMLVRPESGVPAVIKTERTALDELFQGGQNLLTVSSEAINAVSDSLSEENVQSLTGILNNIELASAKIAEKGGLIDTATAAMKSVDEAAVAMEQASLDVDIAAKRFDTDFKLLASDAQVVLDAAMPALQDAREAIASINGTLTQINSDLTPTAGRALEQLALTATDLRSLMVRLGGLAGEIEQDPSRFLYQQPQPVSRE
ncbi:MAG: MlaD family protein [Alphaproteobacteria bacterium]|nr:MlaD family protein [Alphaproteobacteria bacterium]